MLVYTIFQKNRNLYIISYLKFKSIYKILKLLKLQKKGLKM